MMGRRKALRTVLLVLDCSHCAGGSLDINPTRTHSRSIFRAIESNSLSRRQHNSTSLPKCPPPSQAGQVEALARIGFHPWSFIVKD
jgi:hypothetical protein